MEDEDDPLKKPNQRATKKGRYSYIKVLGAGSFGTVLKALDSVSAEVVAIKILEFKRASSKEEEVFLKQSARKEVKILKQLNHEHIISIKDDFEFQKWRLIPKGLAIVMEFCPNGSLSDQLERMLAEGKSATIEERLSWYKQLMSAMAYIHSKSIAHRDIKPENILVDVKKRLKIADVGLSKVLHSEEKMTESVCTLYMKTLLGTYPFMAPEVFNNHYTIKSDIFSMALVMYVICELPSDLIPRVKTNKLNQFTKPSLNDSLGGFLSDLDSSFESHDGLGSFLFGGGVACSSMEALTFSKALPEEKRLFSEMLHSEHHDRPTAKEVVLKLGAMSCDIKKKQIAEEERNKQLTLVVFVVVLAVLLYLGLT